MMLKNQFRRINNVSPPPLRSKYNRYNLSHNVPSSHWGEVVVCPYPNSTSALEGVVWSIPRPCRLYPREGNLVIVVQEPGWASGPIWRSPENLVASGVPTPNRPASSQALFRPRYPCRLVNIKQTAVTVIAFCNMHTVVWPKCTKWHHHVRRVQAAKIPTRLHYLIRRYFSYLVVFWFARF